MKTQFLITLPAILLSVNLFSQVTSVDVQASPSEVFGSSGGPVTTSGTITISLDQQQDNKFLASPSDGSLDDPEFRGIEDADLPIVEEGTQGIISNNTGSTQILGAGDKEFPDRCFFADGATFDNDAPSISFHSSPSTGLYLTTGGDTRINFSIAGDHRMHLSADGSLSIGNNPEFYNQLDFNISHDSYLLAPMDPQDGGINVTTFGGDPLGEDFDGLFTSTFAGRTSSGTYDNPDQTKNNQAMAEFSGKGFYSTSGTPTDFEPHNKGLFGVYAGTNHTNINTATYCGIKTTRNNIAYDGPNHMSLLIDHAGNAGLTYLESGAFGTSTPNGWTTSTDYDSRYFSIEANNTTTSDAGLLIQNSNGSRGINLWFDNSENIAYLDNIRNSNATALQTRFKTYIGGTPIVAITTTLKSDGSVSYTNFGGDTSPDNVLTVGGSSQFQINENGMVEKYNNLDTESNGVPAIYKLVQDASVTAATTSATIYNDVPSDGLYRISWVSTIISTTASSSVLGPFQVLYTDANGEDSKTWPSGNINNFNQCATNSVATGVISGSMIVYAMEGTDILFSIGYTSGGGTMEYDYNIICERL